MTTHSGGPGPRDLLASRNFHTKVVVHTHVHQMLLRSPGTCGQAGGDTPAWCCPPPTLEALLLTLQRAGLSLNYSS